MSAPLALISLPKQMAAPDQRGWTLFTAVSALSIGIAWYFIAHIERLPFVPDEYLESPSWFLYLWLWILAIASFVATIRGAVVLAQLRGLLPLLTIRADEPSGAMLRIRHRYGLVKRLKITSGATLGVDWQPSTFPTSQGKRLELPHAAVWTLAAEGRTVSLELPWPIDDGIFRELEDALAKRNVSVARLRRTDAGVA